MGYQRSKGDPRHPFGRGAKRTVERTAGRLADAGGGHMTNRAQAHTPVLSGRTRESIQQKPVVFVVDESGHPTWQSGAESDWYIARFLEHGTAPHLLPKYPGEVVSFRIGGRTVYAEQFEHPGQRPRKMFAIAAAETEADFRIIAEPALARMRVEIRAG